MDQTVPDSLDALLTRQQAADALTAAGYPTARATLSTKASRGNGPVYSLFGPRALYRWGDLLSWAQHRLSGPYHNTSEAYRKPAA
jgi:hypothetical protein